MTELPEPELSSSLVNRAGDNWRVLIGIADLAGGPWPKLIREAAENAVNAERAPSLIERLLAGIRRAFDGSKGEPNAADNADRLTTPTLLGLLTADPDEDWHTAYRGRPVTAYFLRDRLRGLLQPPEEGKPPGATDWYTGPEDKRQHHRGYLRLQFEEAWSRYLAADSSSSVPLPRSGASGMSGSSGANRGKAAENRGSAAPDRTGSREPTGQVGAPPAPDAATVAPDGQEASSDKKTAEIRQKSDVKHYKPDAPDTHQEGGAKTGTGRPNGNATNGGVDQTSGSSLDDLIRQAASDNPGRSVKWLAQQIGQPEATVRRVLGEHRP